MKVTLTIVKGPDEGRVLEFQEPRGFIIGRAEDAAFRLSPNDPYVGRRHVFLEICPPSCRLQDLGSTNTAKLNGKPTRAAELKDGDLLELGYTQFLIAVNLPSEARVVRKCSRCGRRLEYLPGEQEHDRCLACRQAAADKAVEHAPPPVPAKCAECGSDLTDRANSDGRAKELGTAIVYWCDEHLPKGDRFAGNRIGPYRVIKRLGEGGMGRVFLVYHPPTARGLALKQMRDLKDPLLVRRFEREMRMTKELTHQNVMASVATGVDKKGTPFVVTEYVPGGDLEELVRASGGRLTPRHAVPLIEQVLAGLEYLHSQSIVHRDIKPPNVLLANRQTAGPQRTKEGTQIIPKITDFGLAKSYSRAGGTRLTKAGTGLGTLMFMPPQQVADAGEVREPSDTYAVGVTLYYLLTGRYSLNFPTPRDIARLQQKKPELWRKPHEALRLIMQLHRVRHPIQIILSEDPTPIRERDASLPSALAEVVDKAVKKDQHARFQTAADFRIALRSATA